MRHTPCSQGIHSQMGNIFNGWTDNYEPFAPLTANPMVCVCIWRVLGRGGAAGNVPGGEMPKQSLGRGGHLPTGRLERASKGRDAKLDVWESLVNVIRLRPVGSHSGRVP